MKRFLSIVLAILMLFSSMTLLFSCKDKEEEDEKASGNEGQAMKDDGSIFYERAQVSDGLGEYDFGGRPFRIITHYEGEFHVPEDKRNQGNLITDAKFARNETVEKRFNANIELTYSGTYAQVSEYASKTILAASDEFDLIMGMAIDTGSLVLKDLFLNWYDIENVDFSKPWWSNSNSNELTVDGVCPLAVSDFNQSAITSTFCYAFNKNLAESYELGNLYDVVLDGKWTFDYLYELIDGVYVDNGNDVRDSGDFYGLAHGNGSSLNTYLWSFDNPICQKDEDGIPELAIKTDKINGIFSDVYDLIYNTGAVYFEADAASGASYPTDMFLAKKAIFVPTTLLSCSSKEFRDFEDDYGILPYPKYDENQTNYYTMADGFHTVLAVPKTVKDTEFVGTMVEALSAESWKTVTPTYYEIALKTRYLRDNESKEVLDLIIEGTTYDFGYIYDGWGGFAFSLQRLVSAGNSNFESHYNQNRPNARARYKKIVKAFSKLG